MSTNPIDHSAVRSHERNRRHLRGKARRATQLAKKVASRLSAPPTTNDADVARLVDKLLPVLASLRKSVLKEKQPQSALVAGGIAHLSRAFEGLSKADRASTPTAALKHLAEGHRALESAETNAKKAGDAWPL